MEDEEKEMDQASTLRRMAKGGGGARRSAQRAGSVRAIAITSGKGGVGKTNLVANLSLAISRLGKRVLIFDADLGLSNIDILLGLSPEHNLSHVLSGEKRINDILVKGPGGIRILPASSGVQEMTELAPEQQLQILTELDQIEGNYDYLFVDTGAGISSNVMYFNVASQENIVIATPEPTSITDAYALMKVLSVNHSKKAFKLLVNCAKTPEEGKQVYRKLSMVTSRFLNISLEFLGQIPLDASVGKAVLLQKPFLEAFPTCPASRAIMGVAKALTDLPGSDKVQGNVQFFFRRMVDGSREGGGG